MVLNARTGQRRPYPSLGALSLSQNAMGVRDADISEQKAEASIFTPPKRFCCKKKRTFPKVALYSEILFYHQERLLVQFF